VALLTLEVTPSKLAICTVHGDQMIKSRGGKRVGRRYNGNWRGKDTASETLL